MRIHWHQAVHSQLRHIRFLMVLRMLLFGSVSNSSVLPGDPTLPQSPSTSQQAPVSNQSQCPIYTQQTSKIPKINEDTLASGNPQPAESYPFSYGTEDTTVGSISNSSVLPDGAINPPPYSACAGEHTPDGSTDNQIKSLPPDYASTVTS